jgi:hypothetical protein
MAAFEAAIRFLATQCEAITPYRATTNTCSALDHRHS